MLDCSFRTHVVLSRYLLFFVFSLFLCNSFISLPFLYRAPCNLSLPQTLTDSYKAAFHISVHVSFTFPLACERCAIFSPQLDYSQTLNRPLQLRIDESLAYDAHDPLEFEIDTRERFEDIVELIYKLFS